MPIKYSNDAERQAVLAVLGQGWSLRSIEIASRTGLPRRHVQMALHDLQKAGAVLWYASFYEPPLGYHRKWRLTNASDAAKKVSEGTPRPPA